MATVHPNTVSSHPETCNGEMTSFASTSTSRIQAPSQPTTSAQPPPMHTLPQHAPAPCPRDDTASMPLTDFDTTTQRHLAPACASQCDTIVRACFASTSTPSIATSYCQVNCTSVQRCRSYWAALPSIRTAMLTLLCISTSVHCSQITAMLHQHHLARSKVLADETWDPNIMCAGAGLHGVVNKTATGDLVPLLFGADSTTMSQFIGKGIPIYSAIQVCHQ